jgi:hypothetical protein
MGHFSWMTKEGFPITNAFREKERCFTVYMVLPDGTIYQEDEYAGYGIFGGKDYFIALAELNVDNNNLLLSDDDKRSIGIDLVYSKTRPKGTLFPILTIDPKWSGDFTIPNEDDPDQGDWYPVEQCKYCRLPCDAPESWGECKTCCCHNF